MLKLIVNPKGGNGYALKAEKIVTDELDRRGVPWDLSHTERAGQGETLAAEAAATGRYDAVLAVGGDGTAYEVACGLMGTGIPMGIIPGGTGNDFIKTTGTPRKPLEALEFILTHEPRPVDIGSLNDRMFLNVCGTGFDVTVLDYTLSAKRFCRGLLPYMIGLLRAIFHYEPVDVTYIADGVETHKKVLVCSVDNGRFIGGGIPMCPVAIPDDGLLDLTVVDNVPRRRIPLCLPKLMSGKILDLPFASHVRCKEIVLKSAGMRLNVDGEIFDMDEARFSVQPGAFLLYW